MRKEKTYRDEKCVRDILFKKRKNFNSTLSILKTKIFANNKRNGKKTKIKNL